MEVTANDKALAASQVFTPAAPIDRKTLFAGRTEQVRQVVDAINQRGQHAIIFGERGVGKTSLANIISGTLHNPSGRPLLAPHVNCDAQDDFGSVWKKVLQQILLSAPQRQAGFQSSHGERLVDLIGNWPERASTGDLQQRLMPITSEVTLVVIIDEFDRLTDTGARAMMTDAIKMFSDHPTTLTIVLVGVADTVDKLLTEHLSIERNLVQTPMPRMSEPELREIIDKGLHELELSIDPLALERITSLSRGLPHYTHLLGLHAVRAALDSGSDHISQDHVERAIEKALSGAQQSIRSAYHRATMSQRRGALYRQVLLACALAQPDEMGYFAPADVRGPMSQIMGKPYDIPNFSKHLGEFCSAERGQILEKTGVDRRWRYRFRNPLMQPFAIMQGHADGLVARVLSAPAAPCD